MAKTVKVSVMVAFNDKGHFETEGEWSGEKRETIDSRLERLKGWSTLPHFCMVDIELPIPEPPVGKVVRVKAVKP